MTFDVDWLIDPVACASAPRPVDWDALRDAWLAVAHGIAQGGRPTVLLGSIVPGQLDDLPARRLVTDIHFAVLDCPDHVRRARLAAHGQRRRWLRIPANWPCAHHLATALARITAIPAPG